MQLRVKGKKGQSAMEFLMTYGWAILVVLAAIGALAYFGVLSPEKFIPAKCTLPAGLFCADFRLDTDSITIVLMNSIGRDVTLKNITIGACIEEVDSKLFNGGKKTFTLNCSNAPGRIKETIRISYVDETSGIQKVYEGDIQGEVK